MSWAADCKRTHEPPGNHWTNLFSFFFFFYDDVNHISGINLTRQMECFTNPRCAFHGKSDLKIPENAAAWWGGTRRQPPTDPPADPQSDWKGLHPNTRLDRVPPGAFVIYVRRQRSAAGIGGVQVMAGHLPTDRKPLITCDDILKHDNKLEEKHTSQHKVAVRLIDIGSSHLWFLNWAPIYLLNPEISGWRFAVVSFLETGAITSGSTAQQGRKTT